MKKANTKSIETRRIAKLMTSNTRSIATQTADVDNHLEIAKLQEQIKLLQLENNVLRKHMTAVYNQKLDNPMHEKFFPATQLTPKINEISSCGCKGNCSSRCGCVKKNNKCNPSCKCDYKLCQNQKLKHNHENIENVNKNDLEIFKKQSAKKSKAIETVMNKYNDTEDEEKDKHIQEKYTDNTHPSFTNIENVRVQNLQIGLDCTNIATFKKKRKEKKQNNEEKLHLRKVEEKVDKNAITNDTGVIANNIFCGSNASKDSMMVMFDPMKPRHQLSRTPPNSKKCADEKLLKNLKIDGITPTISQPYNRSFEEIAIKSPNIQDVTGEEIDWEQHTAQLIPCKKCERTFMPHRIQKHEACCKKIFKITSK